MQMRLHGDPVPKGTFMAKAKTDKIETTVTHLEMTNPPIRPPKRSPLARLMLLRLEECPVHFYRYLYDAVGHDYHWVDRKRLSDEDLKAIIEADSTEITVVYVDGAPAGFGEIDYSDPDQPRIAYFGVMKEFQGRGVGGFLLDTLVRSAWSRGITMLSVETCTLDHPNALATYQKIGFVPTAQETRVIEPIR